MKVFFFVLLLVISHSLSAMMLNYEQQATVLYESMKQRLDRRSIKRFMTTSKAKDLQILLGTNLAKTANLENNILSITALPEKHFFLKDFKSWMEWARGDYVFFATPSVNHHGNLIAIPLQFKGVCIRNLSGDETPDMIISFKKTLSRVSKIRWSSDDRYIAVCIGGYGLDVYEVSSGRQINDKDIVVRNDHWFWHPQRPLILCSDAPMSINIIDITNNMLTQTVQVPDLQRRMYSGDGSFSAMEMSPDGMYLALAFSYTVIICKLTDLSFFTLGFFKRVNRKMVWSSDGRYVAEIPYEQGAIIVWDIQTGYVASEVNMPMQVRVVAAKWAALAMAIIFQGFNMSNFKYQYVRVLIDPLDKQACDMVFADLSGTIKNPIGENGTKTKALEDFSDFKITMSDEGDFLIGTDHEHIAICDYSAEQQICKYLRSQIPLKQALILLAIFKSSLNNEKLQLDSSKIQEAFDQLPDSLRVGLEKWVVRPQSGFAHILNGLFKYE